MQRHITIAVCLLTVLCSCKKNNNNTTPQPQQNQNPATVNATEQQLVGIWYQDTTNVTYDDTLLAHLDTSYHGYDNTVYLKFTIDRFDPSNQPENYKIELDAHSPGGQNYTMGSSASIYWFYDTGTNLLNTGTGTYTISTLTASKLVFWYKNAGIKFTYYFHK